MAASGFTNYWTEKVLEHSTGTNDIGALPTVYVALFTTAPTAEGGGTEANYTGYARVATSAADWNSAVDTGINNAESITFAACSGGTNTIVAFAGMDAATDGNMLWFGPASLSVSTGVQPEFGEGALAVTCIQSS